ncbi:head maturation protease, ClpP-related [Brevundimonas vitis]|uniref:head maturation protease, ClpP-related n=1 Tax=Brevundimonas vitisensis TaxID=2800818 RepID=UPI001E5534DC|nr:head maturation protease, ClpP-related [Brevundimonas vitisensis]
MLAKWAESPQAAEADDPNTISVYDVIGEDFWTGGGFTAKRMGAALRAIGKNDVTVKINSPGGDMFEGIAIYNLLRDHPAKVTIEVMGWAASAASIIAMAGDEIKMGLGTFMMVHNAWGVVVGNRHDMRDGAAVFDGFDSAIADIYEARTGMDRNAIVKLMDTETFMGPSEAVENGFADTVDSNRTEASASAAGPPGRAVMARRRTEAALAKAGVSRNDRSEILSELIATPRDASRQPEAARDAGPDLAAVQRLIDCMTPA